MSDQCTVFRVRCHVQMTGGLGFNRAARVCKVGCFWFHKHDKKRAAFERDDTPQGPETG